MLPHVVDESGTAEQRPDAAPLQGLHRATGGTGQAYHGFLCR